MIIEQFPVGPLQCNCSIIACKKSKEAIVIDPGDEADKIIDRLAKHDLKVKYLLHTHAHFDHISATNEVQQKTKAEVCLHPEDLFLYDNIKLQYQKWGFSNAPEVPSLDHHLADGDRFKFGDFEIKIFHTPGHTPGSVCFYLESAREAKLFSGDTLFSGSIGRTDLPGGDYGQIIRSIKTKLLPLAEETIVIPGHGPETSIAIEKKINPFLN